MRSGREVLVRKGKVEEKKGTESVKKRKKGDLWGKRYETGKKNLGNDEENDG